jgi:thiol reductant ABC exporter CydC subunit
MTFVRLVRLARPQWTRLALAGLAGAAATATGIALVGTAAWLISRAAQHPSVLALGVAIVGVRAFGLSKGLFRYGERLAGHDAALRVRTDLRVRLYEQLIRLCPAGLGPARPGVLLRQLCSDVDAAVEVLARVLLPAIAVTVAGVGTAAVLATMTPAAGPVLLAGLAVVLLAVPAVQHRLASRAARRTAPLRAELTAQTVELLHGLPDLIAYGAVPARLAELRDTDQRLRRDAARSAFATGLGAALVALAGGGAVLALLWLGTRGVHIAALDPVLLAVLVLTPIAVFEAAAVLPAAVEQAGAARVGLSRLFAVLDAADPTPDPAEPVAVGATPHLRVVGASARWRADGPIVVSDVDLDLPPGHTVALVGPSGSGKTTVAALLVRLLDPVAGRVTLDGVDLREHTGDDIRTAITLVDSEAHLFDTSIGANLRLGRRDAGDDELEAVLRRVRLWDWVSGLPDGLDTPVGEGGGQVSGGERRRLALARALLRDTPILVLDEPTEHLDPPTAAAVTADLLDATRGRSVVLITHRPYGLDTVDTVIRLTGPEPHVPRPAHR